ncbi:hypothetical protein BC827DRAFT_1241977 [Russula dissimulans]|nr:hypothetical protein BC827DRAFT_1241977 [Russula dissimulans]
MLAYVSVITWGVREWSGRKRGITNCHTIHGTGCCYPNYAIIESGGKSAYDCPGFVDKSIYLGLGLVSYDRKTGSEGVGARVMGQRTDRYTVSVQPVPPDKTYRFQKRRGQNYEARRGQRRWKFVSVLSPSHLKGRALESVGISDSRVVNQ